MINVYHWAEAQYNANLCLMHRLSGSSRRTVNKYANRGIRHCNKAGNGLQYRIYNPFEN